VLVTDACGRSLGALGLAHAISKAEE
jgi:hypothetical protein